MGWGRNGAEDRGVEIGRAPVRAEKEKRNVAVEPSAVGAKDERRENGNELLLRVKSDVPVRNGHDNDVAPVFPVKADEDSKAPVSTERGVDIDFFSDDQEPEDPSGYKQPSDLRYTVTDNPGITLLMSYGIQHYLSLAGSLVFTPLIMIPAMGGTDESSFVYLVPALVIINSEEYRNFNENKFKHIMRELQGAVVVGSVFQAVLGYSGLMSLLLRLINPVVVAPTVAAVGLAYFSYAFPQAGNCVEISIPLILLILIFALVRIMNWTIYFAPCNN